MIQGRGLPSEVAQPGDPDLDCHIFGLRLGPVVVAPVSDYTLEATVEFDASEAAGWWTDTQTGERVFPDKVTEFSYTFGLRLEDGHEYLAAALMERMSAWAKSGALIALTSAPGKWTLLHCPDSPGSSFVVLSRG
jgi:hypothetical protein